MAEERCPTMSDSIWALLLRFLLSFVSLSHSFPPLARSISTMHILLCPRHPFWQYLNHLLSASPSSSLQVCPRRVASGPPSSIMSRAGVMFSPPPLFSISCATLDWPMFPTPIPFHTSAETDPDARLNPEAHYTRVVASST